MAPFDQWVQILAVVTNISILLIGIRLVRHLTRLEIRVEMMWEVFAKRFNVKMTEPANGE